MKKTVTIVAILLTITIGFGQQSKISGNAIGEGGMQVNAGFGLSGRGLPIYVGFDYGIHPDITIGGQLDYRSYTEDWGHASWAWHGKVKYTYIGLSFNGNYHFNTLLNIDSNMFDLYAGLNLGYYLGSAAWIDNDDRWDDDDIEVKDGFEYGIQVGGRWYFKDNVALNLELGGPLTWSGGSGAKIGISARF